MAPQIIDRFYGEYEFLSNFHLAPVMYEGQMYRSSEAAFQAAKVCDPEKRIPFTTMDSYTAKKAGRKVTLRHDWNEIRDQVMYRICLDKFTRNPKLREKLLATGDALLIEGNHWKDTYWGVCDGVGQNKLGNTLMHIRGILKENTPK